MKTLTPKQINYSWSSFDRDVNLLVQLLKQTSFKPKTIVAIAVGGLCLGAKLRNILKAPLTIISTALYKEAQRKSVLTLNASYTVPLRNPILLCDEIVDTGTTLKAVKKHLELGGLEVKTATLFYKISSSIKPDYYIHQTNKWVVMPWEKI